LIGYGIFDFISLRHQSLNLHVEKFNLKNPQIGSRWWLDIRTVIIISRIPLSTRFVKMLPTNEDARTMLLVEMNFFYRSEFYSELSFEFSDLFGNFFVRFFYLCS
jgi:hypothetical protein